MADTKYSALTLTVPTGSDKFGIAQTGTSFAVTISSAVAAGSTQITAQVTSNTADPQVLFNNSGVVSSDTLFQYQYSTQVLSLSGASSQINLKAHTLPGASTASSTLAFYVRNLGGRLFPKVVGPAGMDYALQPSFFQQAVTYWNPTTSASGNWERTSGYNVGTYSTALPQPNSLYQSMHRGVYSNSSASTNLQAGQAGNELLFTRASTAGMGGFFYFARVGVEQYQTSTRYLVGLTSRATADICTSDTNTYLNTLGFKIDAASTAWVFYHSSTGAGTSETISGQNSLVNASTNGAGFDFYIYCPSNTNTVYFRMDDINNNSTIIASSVTNHLPNSTSYLRPFAMCGNLTNSTGAAKIGIVTMYCETDI